MVSNNYTEQQLDALARHKVATRCFLETGDDDYIAARLAYRAVLVHPFLWSALQAIEKYLKCILLLNGISTKGLRHDIKLAFKKIDQDAPFKIILQKPEQEIFDHIANFGPDRYLTQSHYIHDRELPKLDMLVWHLRQYCRVINHEITLVDGSKGPMLQGYLDAIGANWKRPAKYGHLPFGKLEKILARKNHPSRAALVWKNLYYSSSRRRSVRMRIPSTAVNAPLSLDPGLLPRIEQLVEISKEQKNAYMQLWQQMQRKKSVTGKKS